MNEQEFIEQEDYELNGYDESAIENEYYDIDGEESEDDIFEDDVFDYIEEESEMDESRRRRKGKGLSRWPRKIPNRNSIQGGFRGLRPRRFPGRINYGKPKPIKYFRPNVPRRPASTKNVVKAFATASKDIANTKTAIRKVDVDNKVQEQKLKKTFSSQSKRISGNEYALAATTVVNKLGEEFPEFKENPIVNTLLSAAPTFLQKPIKKEFYKDPRVLTTGLTALIAIVKEFRDKAKTPEVVQNVSISPPVKAIIVGNENSFSFTAVARDSKGNKIEGKTFDWFSEDPSIVSVVNVDGKGKITGLKAGSTKVFAQETGSERSTNVAVAVKVGAAINPSL